MSKTKQEKLKGVGTEGQEDKQNKTFQAVIIADDFNEALTSFDSSMPIVDCI